MLSQQQLALFEEYNSYPIKFPTTRYQGSKQKFVDWIWECIKEIPFQTALDAFGGTGCVAFKLKEEGKLVTYNDILRFNHIIGKALIENVDTILTENEIDELLRVHKNVLYPNFIARTFDDIYYTKEENQWLDVVAYNIRQMKNEYKQAIAYFALFQSCIIKRPYNLFHRKNLYVRMQDVERSFGNKKTWDTPFNVHFRRFVREANQAVFDNHRKCRSINENIFDVDSDYDFVYIDTPYINEAGIGVDYAEFYHFLNGIVNYDDWDSMIDYSTRHLRLYRKPNEWNDSEAILTAFQKLFYKFRNSIMAISYRSNGIPTINEIVDILENIGKQVSIYKSNDMKYALSTKQSNEILIVAR